MAVLPEDTGLRVAIGRLASDNRPIPRLQVLIGLQVQIGLGVGSWKERKGIMKDHRIQRQVDDTAQPHLTCHLQRHGCAVVIADADEAGEAALICNLHASQEQRDVALGQLVIEEGRAVGVAPALVGQLVPAIREAVHQALGVRQLPDEAEVLQAEVGLGGEGTVQGGILAIKGHHGLFRDLDLHGTCRMVG